MCIQSALCLRVDTEVEFKNKQDAAAAAAGDGILSPSQSSPKHSTDYDSDYEKVGLSH